MKTFTIAYCNENQAAADALAQQLRIRGTSVQLIPCQPIDPTPEQQPNFGQQLEMGTHPVLLLVSDNFLKSETCLLNLLPSMRKLHSQSRLKPVVTKGWIRQADGSTQEVDTEFDRVSQVIKYMNHWSDVYLAARKEKRDADNDSSSYSKRLKDIRSISAEVGELLRFLRNIDCYDYDKLMANNGAGLQSAFGLGQNEASRHTVIVQDDSAHTKPTHSTPPAQDSMTINERMAQELGYKKDAVLKGAISDIPEPVVNKQEESSKSFTEALEKPSTHPYEQTEVPVSQTDTQHHVAVQSTEESSHSISDIFEEVSREEEKREEEKREEENTIIENATNTSVHTSDDHSQQPIDEFADEDFEEFAEQVHTPETPINPLDRVGQTASYLVQSGEVDQGISLLQTLLNHEPQHASSRYQLADYLLHYKKDHAAAKEQLRKLLEQDPNHAMAYVRLAEIAQQREQYQQAYDYLSKAAELDPLTKGIDYQMGLLLQNHFAGRQSDAAHHFKKAFTYESRNADAYYRYAMLLSEDEAQHDQAVYYYKKTLHLEPEHPFANYDLALLYHQQKNWEMAPVYYRRATEINPELKTDQNDEAFGLHLTPLERRQREAAALLPFYMPSKEQKVVLITGATSGIGRATAQVFAQAGYRTILTGRRQDRLEELSQLLYSNYQVESKVLSFDVRNHADVLNALSQLDGDWENIEILINNAGLAKGLAPIHEGDWSHWDTMIDTNIKGVLRMTRLIAPHMVKRGKGHIINLCSTAGKEVYRNGNVYCATKHAVDALTRGMRLDLHPYGIRVSQVSPAHVEETEFAINRFDGDADKANIYEDFNPLVARDVAETIFFIATRPPHVNIQDVVLMGTQQADSNHIDRSGRKYD